MDWSQLLIGFGAALAISILTAPIGVSGAVFLLPVQLSVLQVPNPAVTPTNLLYNVISGPGALWRYSRRASLRSPLLRLFLLGTVPGVIVGSSLRVFVLADPAVFRICAAAVLLPLGIWLLVGTPSTKAGPGVRDRLIVLLAAMVGVIGGVYGIGGGSLLSPILIATGVSVAAVAPAALLSTLVTSIIGSLTFVGLSLVADGSIAPDWPIGIACGVGGLVGGYLGATLQPYLPEAALRRLAGTAAATLAVFYLVEALL